MNHFIILVLFFFQIISGDVIWFHQKVDHFDALNSDLYLQKVIINDTWFQPGGPIFLFLGGEAPVEFFEFQEVSAKSWAAKLNALYIAIEHRFYGDSMPTPDFGTYNLKFLSSQQALADASYFIESYNSTLIKPGPWIVLGCSYSGALSAWFRSKYPHLVVGSVAPSGPVFAQTNYSGYYAHFQRVAGGSCISAVKSAVAEISTMLKTDSGRSQLSKIFNSCEPIGSDPSDYYYFLETLTETVASSDQFNNPDMNWPLNQTCNTLTKNSNYIQNWAELVSQQQLKKTKKSSAKCNNFNEQTGFIAPLTVDTNPDRAWWFQMCTEFGFFTPSINTIFFELDLMHQVEYCEKIFGISHMQPNTFWTNSYYGGFDLQATNVLFTNGIFDPWHLLSINSDLPSPSGVKAITYDAGHCAPMTVPTANDPPSLTKAREQVFQFLSGLVKSSNKL